MAIRLAQQAAESGNAWLQVNDRRSDCGHHTRPRHLSDRSEKKRKKRTSIFFDRKKWMSPFSFPENEPGAGGHEGGLGGTKAGHRGAEGRNPESESRHF